MKRYLLATLLLALLLVVPAGAQPGDLVYDGPLTVPWAHLRATEDGYVLRWEVDHAADSWSLVVGWTTVWQSEGTFAPGALAEAAIPTSVYAPENINQPGGRLQVCAAWDHPPINGIPQPRLTQCRAVLKVFRVALPLIHR
jgi:hypothetical protein